MDAKTEPERVGFWEYRIVKIRRSWRIQRRTDDLIEGWSNSHGWVPWARGSRWMISKFKARTNALLVAGIIPGVRL